MAKRSLHSYQHIKNAHSTHNPGNDVIWTAWASFPQLITYYAWTILAATSSSIIHSEDNRESCGCGPLLTQMQCSGCCSCLLWVCLIWDLALICHSGKAVYFESFSSYQQIWWLCYLTSVCTSCVIASCRVYCSYEMLWGVMYLSHVNNSRHQIVIWLVTWGKKILSDVLCVVTSGYFGYCYWQIK